MIGSPRYLTGRTLRLKLAACIKTARIITVRIIVTVRIIYLQTPNIKEILQTIDKHFDRLGLAFTRPKISSAKQTATILVFLHFQ